MEAASSQNGAPIPIEGLPTEILSQILVRLPNIKCLLRAKLVCKSWFTLISSLEFADLYNLRHNNSLLAYPKFDLNCNLYLYAVEVSDNDFSKEEKIQLPPYLYDELGFRMIVASCNDLLLCIFGSTSDSTLILLNPLTRLYHVIPRLYYDDNNFVIHGVGYDHIKDDYIVFILSSDRRTTANADVFLYSLRDESWQRKCYLNNQEITTLSGYNFCPNFWMISRNLKPTVVANCLLHFVYECKKVASFNVCNGNWSEIPAPGVQSNIKDIGVLDGYLSVLEGKGSRDGVSSSGFKLWVMKEYGVKESWVLLLSVSDLYPIRSSLTSIPLAISSDKNEILLHLKHDHWKFSYVWYNLKEKKTRKAQIGPWEEYVSIKSIFPVTDITNKFNKKKQDLEEMVMKMKRIIRLLCHEYSSLYI